jgi:hypothetical protein
MRWARYTPGSSDEILKPNISSTSAAEGAR